MDENLEDIFKNDRKSNEYQSFSLFQLFLKFFIYFNLLLSILIVADFFLPEKFEMGEINEIRRNEALVYFENSDWAYINIGRKNVSKLSLGDSISVSFTPIFSNRKSFYFNNGKDYSFKGTDTPFLLPVSTIIFNLMAFILFIVFPSLNDYASRKLDIKLSDFLFRYRFSMIDYLWYVYVLPFVLSWIYWYKFYNYIFGNV